MVGGMSPATRTPHRLRSLVIVAVVVSVLAGGIMLMMERLPRAVREELLGAPATVPQEFTSVIREAAERCPSVPVNVFAAQLHAESGWDPNALSPAGAQGIAQFMPATWKQFGIDADNDGSADVWNPIDAIHSAAELNCVNRKLVANVDGKKLHNLLAAYNAGHGAVREYNGVPPFPETENYVTKILESSKTIQWQ